MENLLKLEENQAVKNGYSKPITYIPEDKKLQEQAGITLNSIIGLGIDKNFIGYKVNAIINITPEIAGHLLQNNHENRDIKKGRVSFYAKQIKEGKWELTSETIKFTTDLTLIDGQHRLLAIIDAGTTALMEISFGLNKSIFKLLDTGKSRTAADILSMLKVENSAKVATILRTLIAYERGALIGITNSKTSQMVNSTISRSYKINDASIITNDDIENAYYLNQEIPKYFGKRRCKNLGFETAYVFIHYILSKKDPVQSEIFINYIYDGEHKDNKNVYKNDMLWELRERLINKNLNKDKYSQKINTREIIGLCFKAWKYFITGKNVKRVNWSFDEGIPQI